MNARVRTALTCAAVALAAAGYAVDAKAIEEGPSDLARLPSWLAEHEGYVGGMLAVAERHELAEVEQLREAFDAIEAARDLLLRGDADAA